jgi:anti-sigma factor RsiW
MKCRRIRGLLSDYLDGELDVRLSRAVGCHLEECPGCAAHLASLESSLEQLRDMPRQRPEGTIAFQVLNRIEVESRGPGLALLFRPAWRARPLILPSLVPAALVLVSVLAGVLAVESEPGAMMEREPAAWAVRLPPSGTEGNPLFPSAEVAVPRMRASAQLAEDAVLAKLPEGSVFFETVVARDGSVANVTILGGEPSMAAALVKALRDERFEPTRLRGRPVAVSVYRLISHMEVRATVT